jgi:hypothetical protein
MEIECAINILKISSMKTAIESFKVFLIKNMMKNLQSKNKQQHARAISSIIKSTES